MSPEDVNLSSIKHLPSLAAPVFGDSGNISSSYWGALAKREDGKQMVYHIHWNGTEIVLYDLPTPMSSESFPLRYWNEPNMLKVSSCRLVGGTGCSTLPCALTDRALTGTRILIPITLTWNEPDMLEVGVEMA